MTQSNLPNIHDPKNLLSEEQRTKLNKLRYLIDDNLTIQVVESRSVRFNLVTGEFGLLTLVSFEELVGGLKALDPVLWRPLWRAAKQG